MMDREEKDQTLLNKNLQSYIYIVVRLPVYRYSIEYEEIVLRKYLIWFHHLLNIEREGI